MAGSSGTRPEHLAPAEVFYDGSEAKKYTSSSRIIDIQAQMAYRCIELLALPPGRPGYILDIGCGSGLSGGERATSCRLRAAPQRARDQWVGILRARCLRCPGPVASSPRAPVHAAVRAQRH